MKTFTGTHGKFLARTRPPGHPLTLSRQRTVTRAGPEHSYSDAAIRVVREARREAGRQGQLFVSPSHLLGALLFEPNTVVAKAIHSTVADPRVLETGFAHAQTPMVVNPVPEADVTFDQASRKVLEEAKAWAAAEGSPLTCSQHILFSLLDEAGSQGLLGGLSGPVLREKVKEVAASEAEGPEAVTHPLEDQVAALRHHYQAYMRDPTSNKEFPDIQVCSPGYRGQEEEEEDIYN